MKTLVLQSNKESLASVEDFLGVLCDEMHINNYYATISVPILHAVENAIVHGNNNDPQKKVLIHYGECRGGLSFAIEDEGNGFDYSDCGSLTGDTCSGEGLFLMKMLSDKLEFLNNGSTVRMEFAIGGVDAAHVHQRIATLNAYYKIEEIEA